MAPVDRPDDGRRGRPDGRPECVSAALDALTDVVVLVDEARRIRYANPFTFELLGHDPGDVIGAHLGGFIHPDDLERALEVLGAIAGDGGEAAVTPAAYRMAHADGSYRAVELNGARAEPEGDAIGHGVLIVGRYSGDTVAQNAILARLTSGASLEDVLEAVVGIATWRLPHEHFAVVVPAAAAGWATAGSGFLLGQLGVPGPDADLAVLGWLASSTDPATVIATGDLPDPLAAAGRAQGLTRMFVRRLPDPLTGGHAVLLAWADDLRVPSAVTFSLDAMARNLDLVLQWRHQVIGLENAARHDPLTGVLNRAGCFDVLVHETQQRPGRGLVGVLYLDLDGFKAVNDRHGHATGDAVLVATAERIQRVLRPGDVVGRLGGDEFVVICPDVPGPQDALAIGARMLSALSAEPSPVPGDTEGIRASLGVAVAAPGALGADALLERADRALYAAKSAGRGTVRLG